MTPVTLVLPFLAERTYLHGTTLFDALAPFAPDDAALSFKFSRMIASNHVALAGPDSGDAPEAIFSWERGTASGRIWVRALPPIEPLKRQAYPESVVLAQTRIEGERIVLLGPPLELEPGSGSPQFPQPVQRAPTATLIASLVPMQKALLAHQSLDAQNGRWVFTRLDFTRRVALWNRLELQVSAVLARQLVRSTILADDVPIGSIYFSWKTDCP
jgi:hypothetical protein